MSLDEIIRKGIRKFYNKNKKHISLFFRVGIVMFFSIIIGMNCLYIEDYILLIIFVVIIGLLVFFMPVKKIDSFLSLGEEDKK